jgi:hypothetical protein
MQAVQRRYRWIAIKREREECHVDISICHSVKGRVLNCLSDKR